MNFDASLDSLLLPSIAGANVLHLHALQRYVTPVVHGELEKAFVDTADSNESSKSAASERSKRATRLLRFQKALKDANRRTKARSQLLARILSQSLEPSAAQCISLVENASFACAHTLLAAQPHTAGLFVASTRRSLPIDMRTSPLQFIHKVYLAASDAIYSQPFLFLRDVSALDYVGKRQKIVAVIDDLVEAELYNMCASSIAALRTHVRMRHKKSSSSALASSRTVDTAQSLAASQSHISERSHSTSLPVESGEQAVRSSAQARSGTVPPERLASHSAAQGDEQSTASSQHILEIPLPENAHSAVAQSLDTTSAAEVSHHSPSATSKSENKAVPIVQLVN